MLLNKISYKLKMKYFKNQTHHIQTVVVHLKKGIK